MQYDRSDIVCIDNDVATFLEFHKMCDSDDRHDMRPTCSSNIAFICSEPLTFDRLTSKAYCCCVRWTHSPTYSGGWNSCGCPLTTLVHCRYTVGLCWLRDLDLWFFNYASSWYVIFHECRYADSINRPFTRCGIFCVCALWRQVILIFGFLCASAMLKHVIAIGLTSVRPSVRPSHAGTLSKRLNILSCFLHHTIAHSF